MCSIKPQESMLKHTCVMSFLQETTRHVRFSDKTSVCLYDSPYTLAEFWPPSRTDTAKSVKTPVSQPSLMQSPTNPGLLNTLEQVY